MEVNPEPASLRSRRRLFLRLALAAGFAAIIFHGPILAGISEWLVVNESARPADAIVVISGGYGEDREVWGAHLYRAGYAKKIFVSGGHIGWADISDAEVMRLILIREKVPHGVIVIEPRATSTYENALYLQPLLRTAGVRSILLVTSAYHSRRARMTFDRVTAGDGIRITSMSTREADFQPGTWWRNRLMIESVVREYASFVWYTLRGYLKWGPLV